MITTCQYLSPSTLVGNNHEAMNHRVGNSSACSKQQAAGIATAPGRFNVHHARRRTAAAAAHRPIFALQPRHIPLHKHGGTMLLIFDCQTVAPSGGTCSFLAWICDCSSSAENQLSCFETVESWAESCITARKGAVLDKNTAVAQQKGSAFISPSPRQAAAAARRSASGIPRPSCATRPPCASHARPSPEPLASAAHACARRQRGWTAPVTTHDPLLVSKNRQNEQ